MHASTFRNGTLGESGVGPIEALFNRGPFLTSGGEAVINATGWSVQDGYETNWLPSMRMIVDLSNLNNSVTVHTTGESGHAYHPHYDDMAPSVGEHPILFHVVGSRGGRVRHGRTSGVDALTFHLGLLIALRDAPVKWSISEFFKP